MRSKVKAGGDGGPAIRATRNAACRLASDGHGTLWFLDGHNKRVRRIPPDGIINTIALSFSPANAAPRLGTGAIVNGASFAAGPIAPGEIVTIFGAGVGPQQLAVATPAAGRFATQLGGARVRFNGVEAPVLFARFDQVGAIVPLRSPGRHRRR